mgnify:CR=1 FL=1
MRQDSEMHLYSIKLVLLLCLFALSANSFSQQLVAPKKRPNVLLLVADDMNWDSPGCFGGAAPNINPTLTSWRVKASGSLMRMLIYPYALHQEV